MHASNLQLNQYFLSGLNYSVNPDFDPELDVNIKLTDISVDYETVPLNQETNREWQVELKVGFSPSVESNSPYAFSAEIVGFFSVSEKVRDDKVVFYIETNATSVLYSTLREIVYTITAKGPFRALLLPTVCFYEKKNNPAISKADDK